MPLDERHKLSQAIISARMRDLLDRITQPGPLVELRRRDYPGVPPTLGQRTTHRCRMYGERIALAWRVLRGDDIHEDCE